MTVDKNIGNFIVKGVRMIYPVLLQAKPYMEKGVAKGVAKYSATFMLKADHPDLPAIKAKLTEIAAALWPGVPLGECFPPEIDTRNRVGWPLRSGNVDSDK